MDYGDLDEQDRKTLLGYLQDSGLELSTGKSFCTDTVTGRRVKIESIIMSDHFLGYRFGVSKREPYKLIKDVDRSSFEHGIQLALEGPDIMDRLEVERQKQSDLSGFSVIDGSASARVRIYNHILD